MLDIGWSELLIIGALALIVVGPRDLPHLLRSVGQWVGKIKRMGREFQRSLEDAARETDVATFKEMRDLKKDLGSLDFKGQASRAQSYMNQPVHPTKTEAKAGEPAVGGAAAAPAGADTGAPAEPAAQPVPDGPVEAAEPREAAKG